LPNSLGRQVRELNKRAKPAKRTYHTTREGVANQEGKLLGTAAKHKKNHKKKRRKWFSLHIHRPTGGKKREKKRKLQPGFRTSQWVPKPYSRSNN